MGSDGFALKRQVSLWLLALVAVVNYFDRQVFTVLMEDIKAELVLNDTVLGLISGLVFGIIYAVAALPIARLADKGDRPLVIGACLGIWSLATAACGFAANAWQMAIARMTVAVGESGSGPASMSVLTEIFPPERRVLVIGVMQAASSVGLSFGVIVAAWLASFLPWRSVFLVMGLPGVLLAILVAVFVWEPRRKGGKIGSGQAHETVPMLEALRIMAAIPALRWISLLCVAVPMAGFGYLMWGPSFLQRVHGFEKSELALLGYAILVGLVAGNLFAGWLGDKYGKDNPRFNGWLSSVGLLAAIPFALGFALLPDPNLALVCFVGLKFFMTLWVPPTLALVFSLVPAEMRATISAVFNLFIILAGVGLGTMVVGLLSDAYTVSFGSAAIRYSLVTMTAGLAIGAVASAMAARSVMRRKPAP